MIEFFGWFTDLGNSKTAAAVIFFGTFIAINIYVFTNKSRKERFDKYRFIPLMDDEDMTHFDERDVSKKIDNDKE